jgi:hypothetical protein
LFNYYSNSSDEGSYPLFFFFNILNALFIIFFETFLGALGKFYLINLFSSLVVGSLPLTFIKLCLYVSKISLNSSKDGSGLIA